MELIELMRKRRSVRIYTGEAIPEDKLNTILEAGLLSASGRNFRPWEFVVVTDRNMLEKLSLARVGAADMLKKAGAAIIVLGDENKTDTYIEDTSIALANMHLMADSLGLGSCWIQGRGRQAKSGETTEEYVRSLIDFPQNMRLEAILSIGVITEHPDSKVLTETDKAKVHYGKY